MNYRLNQLFLGLVIVGVALSRNAPPNSANRLENRRIKDLDHLQFPRQDRDGIPDSNTKETRAFPPVNPYAERAWGPGAGFGPAGGPPAGINVNSGFDFEKATRVRNAHGAVAAITMVGIFPIGAILIRTGGNVWPHAGIQAFGLVGLLTAVALGISLGRDMRNPRTGQTVVSRPNIGFHFVIGIIVFVALLLQPILGLLHHRRFKKMGTREVWSRLHLWIGRVAITAGIINGGLGLWVAGAGKTGAVSYGVVAGFVWLIWVVLAIRDETRRTAGVRSRDSSRKDEVMD